MTKHSVLIIDNDPQDSGALRAQDWDDNADWAKKTGHSSTSQVAAVAKKANVGRLVLVHINPRSTDDDPVGLEVARGIFPKTEIGEDLMELDF